MRSKEVEEAIQSFEQYTKIYNDVMSKKFKTVLSYISELEEENKKQRGQLNSAFDNGFIHKDKIRELIEECKKEGCCSDELKEYYDNKCVKICRFYEVCTLLRRLVERKTDEK